MSPFYDKVQSVPMSGTVIAFRASVEPWLYRFAAYFMLTILDDPAMLALAFIQ
jgi:hypothetical protein